MTTIVAKKAALEKINFDITVDVATVTKVNRSISRMIPDAELKYTVEEVGIDDHPESMFESSNIFQLFNKRS